MQLDTITRDSFQGKFIIPKPLPVRERKFAEKLLDYKLKGVTNEEYLRRKNFDVDIFKCAKKKTPNHKLSFRVGIKHIGTQANERGSDITTVKAEIVNIADGVDKATYNLRKFIDETESYIKNNLQTQYNNDFQKLLIKIAMFLGIF